MPHRFYIPFLLLASLLVVGCSNQTKSSFTDADLETIPDKIGYLKDYDGHLQGMATDYKSLYWSHTKQLVKTDLSGKVMKTVDVPFHHGDLDFYKGKVYVAVNFGKFNEEPGLADSWIWVFSEDLELLDKYPVPEVVHGAGGIAIHKGKAIVVGGLPGSGNHQVNYVYEYDLDFNLVKTHELSGGYTYKGIQTAAYYNNYWYFGCYGNESLGYKPVVLKVKENKEGTLELVEKFDLDMSYGIIGLQGNEYLCSNRSLDHHAARIKLPE